jgi:hydroxyacylglutathione hydrolase
MFQRFFDEGLAQASFLIGCDRTKQAIVIDPRRDAAIYLDAARQSGATLVAAVDTHIHADFVSGGSELAATGVRVIHGAADNERMALGDIAITFLRTPGHTPEHICLLVETPGQPTRLFTGDLLFVGAVGRPDLLGDAQTRRLAHDLFDSLQRVMALDDAIEVHPGHGAGSLCGAGIGNEPSSTIARERSQSPLLQHRDREAFVAAVLDDLPETPPYFARMKRVNAEGAPVLGLAGGPPRVPSIKPAAAAALAADGAVILDLRDSASFSAGHPYGAINLGFGSKVGYWGGWVLDADAHVILLTAEPAQAQQAAVQLLRVGIDRVEGAILGGYDGWLGAALPTATIESIPAADLRATSARAAQLVDVRSPREWRAGHIDGAINIPVGEIPARARELAANGPVVTICEGGYRSSLAASLLALEGAAVSNVAGGMAAYRALEPTA